MRSKESRQKRTASLFWYGQNQAVRLPVEFTLDVEEVFIEQVDSKIILTPKPITWEAYFKNSQCLSEDFPDDIEELPW